MKRTFIDYLWLYFKGMFMGAADIVPGVSGGTIAFISGIYEELISSLSQFKFSLFSDLKGLKFKAVWKTINGNFLLTVFLGIISSILLLSEVVTWLLDNTHTSHSPPTNPTHLPSDILPHPTKP